MAEMIQSFKTLTERQSPSAGGKGGTLARLYQAGYPVPDGFVILPVAFAEDRLEPEAWVQVQAHLADMRRGDSRLSFAVRSSALREDSVFSSFAGEFETVLDVHTDEAVRAAIHTVRQSRHSERVRAYSQAHGVTTDGDAPPEMAIVVQRLVRADIAGVLFTADPVSGSHAQMAGNFVFGFGQELVSGEAEPYTFTLARPKGQYQGPPELKRFGRTLYKLAGRLEKEMGCPQDIEWAVAGGRLFLLQSRPITTLIGYSPSTGERNDSLTGDYLWSNANLTEAVPDVMTPLTWSIWEIFHRETAISFGDYPMTGNIGGRPYANMSVGVSLYMALGNDLQKALAEMADTIGRAPKGLEIPLIPMSRLAVLRAIIPAILLRRRKYRQLVGSIPEFVATSPAKCRELRQQIHKARTKAELDSLWRNTLRPYYSTAGWMLRFSAKPHFELAKRLHRDLTRLVGEADAKALLSNLGGDADLASLGPLLGLSRLARGEMSREEYLEQWGHRGPHELEFSLPHPVEDADWLDRQLAEMARTPVDAEALLARQAARFDAAWQRFQERYPRQAHTVRRRIEQVAEASRTREAVRSEFTRLAGVIRAWALRAGELTGLGEGIFFLTLEEILDVLSGKDAVVAFIPARKKTHARYEALPPYPTIISGRFDPFAWVADPHRRSDYFDSHASGSIPDADAITGFAGAAGRVEGRVRVLDSPEDGGQLLPGEILVAVTTNVGWTPLFPRAAAIVTDVGAPLSHAAIVARELGIPAVIGCGNATMRLRTGDVVRVDGGQGVVEILVPAGRR